IPAPSTTSGAKADISSVSSSFSSVQGKGKKTTGVVLSKLSFGSSGDSDSTAIEFIWADPDQATSVLLNPNAFLEVRVYFLDSDQTVATDGGYTGDCSSSTQRAFEDSGTKYVCPDPDDTHAFKTLSIQNTAATFLPSLDGQSTLYILADIHVPGGAPAGQQGQLTTLNFNVNIS
ncbi:MAG: hypothetical protein HOL45_08970, partial [Chloroflexi bacterium]|nr:hypothetical protein [Chloroflexota bacterium]